MKTGARKISAKVGLPPGTLIHIGEKKSEKVRISLIEYNETHVREQELNRLDEFLLLKERTGSHLDKYRRPSPDGDNRKSRRTLSSSCSHAGRHCKYGTVSENRRL